jgi:tetratricopeptide (TPR) repeat protein
MLAWNRNQFKNQIKNKKSVITVLTIILVLIAGGFYYFKVIKINQPEPELSLEQKKELSLEKLKQVKEAMKENNYTSWEKLAQEAVDLNPENIPAYILLGQSKYVLGKTEEAKDVYLKGLENDSENFQMNFNLANTYRDLGEYENSAKYYEKSLEINPDDVLVWSNYAFLFVVQEKWEKAQEICEEGLKKFPDDPVLKSIYETVKEKLIEK